MFIIYKATNITNDKVYIGYTGGKLKTRINHHKWNAFTQQSKTKFYSALRKHGFVNFKWEIVFMSNDRDYCLEVAEDLIINNYNSIKLGYNSMNGGIRGPTLYGKENGMFGKTHSAEFKKAQSERAKKLFTGRTYEDIYGEEKANQLKEKRRSAGKLKNNKGSNNSRFDNTLYHFQNKNGERFSGLRSDFIGRGDVNASGVCDIISGKRSHHRGWYLA